MRMVYALLNNLADEISALFVNGLPVFLSLSLSSTCTSPQVNLTFAIITFVIQKIVMDPKVVNRLFDEGAFLLILNVPPGTEFGIDLNTFRTGEKFMGIKMIPPGIHFVYYR